MKWFKSIRNSTMYRKKHKNYQRKAKLSFAIFYATVVGTSSSDKIVSWKSGNELADMVKLRPNTCSLVQGIKQSNLVTTS